MSSAADAILDDVEQLVLLAVQRLGDKAHAVLMRELIERAAGVAIPRGTLYVALERLEGRGYLTSRFSDAATGKARRSYALKPAGVRALQASQRAAIELARETDFAKRRSNKK